MRKARSTEATYTLAPACGRTAQQRGAVQLSSSCSSSLDGSAPSASSGMPAWPTPGRTHAASSTSSSNSSAAQTLRTSRDSCLDACAAHAEAVSMKRQARQVHGSSCPPRHIMCGAGWLAWAPSARAAAD